MNTNTHESLHEGTATLVRRDEVYAVVGAAMEVLNEVGHGYHEKPYERALVVEFAIRGISCEQQRSFEMNYKGEKIGEFIPDLIAFGSVVVDTKVVPKLTDLERGKMLNYLKLTGYRVGVLLNFAKPKLEWERIVL